MFAAADSADWGEKKKRKKKAGFGSAAGLGRRGGLGACCALSSALLKAQGAKTVGMHPIV